MLKLISIPTWLFSEFYYLMSPCETFKLSSEKNVTFLNFDEHQR